MSRDETIGPSAENAAAATMMAARIHAFGGPGVIRYERVPRPEPGPGEVLIRVAASGFNISDIGFRAGLLRNIVPRDLPFTLGAEAAGTVSQLGDGVDSLEVGDHVLGRTDRGGTAAEYVAVNTREVVRAPTGIPLAEAAGIPVAGMTAWQALFEHAQVRSGTRILINGAGGGVGMFAVQLAHHAGARVLATASSRSADRVRAYGAEQIIDYRSTPLVVALDRPVDVALNLVPLSVDKGALLCRTIRDGGSLVSVTGPIEPPADTGVTATHFVARNDTAQLANLVRLIESGVIRVDITATYTLAQVEELHAAAGEGRTSGKVIVIP
jgi:NADPH:quinone reductase-like Zn-dependent oxidoreductase